MNAITGADLFPYFFGVYLLSGSLTDPPTQATIYTNFLTDLTITRADTGDYRLENQANNFQYQRSLVLLSGSATAGVTFNWQYISTFQIQIIARDQTLANTDAFTELSLQVIDHR